MLPVVLKELGQLWEMRIIVCGRETLWEQVFETLQHPFDWQVFLWRHQLPGAIIRSVNIPDEVISGEAGSWWWLQDFNRFMLLMFPWNNFNSSPSPFVSHLSTSTSFSLTGDFSRAFSSNLDSQRGRAALECLWSLLACRSPRIKHWWSVRGLDVLHDLDPLI